jgi:putative SOS response-associated peptidase YedK
MCNRARNLSEPPTLVERFGARWLTDRPIDNRFAPAELYPKNRSWVLRSDDRGIGIDVMAWDVLAGAAKWPMTNVRQLGLPQWRRLAQSPTNRCLIPLTEFAEWTPEKHAEHGIKGEMWFNVTDQPTFAIGGFWQAIGDHRGFAMVTCDPNELVAPIHPKAMITILAEADWERWLTGSYDDVVSLQQPYPAAKMTVRGPVFPTRQKTKAP